MKQEYQNDLDKSFVKAKEAYTEAVQNKQLSDTNTEFQLTLKKLREKPEIT
jgi:hypothetical protein